MMMDDDTINDAFDGDDEDDTRNAEDDDGDTIKIFDEDDNIDDQVSKLLNWQSSRHSHLTKTPPLAFSAPKDSTYHTVWQNPSHKQCAKCTLIYLHEGLINLSEISHN